MECHRCEHQAAVAAGAYRGIAFQQTPCGRCELADRSAFVIEYDEERGAGEAGEQPATPRPARLTLAESSTRDVPFPDEFAEDEPAMPVSVLGDVVWVLLSMPPRTRDIVCWRFAGLSYREIARMLGVSMAAAELRHKRALVKWPALRVLFSEKSTKQVRRKPHECADDTETGNFRPDSVYATGV
jgi:hypothetical protein